MCSLNRTQAGHCCIDALGLLREVFPAEIEGVEVGTEHPGATD